MRISSKKSLGEGRHPGEKDGRDERKSHEKGCEGRTIIFSLPPKKDQPPVTRGRKGHLIIQRQWRERKRIPKGSGHNEKEKVFSKEKAISHGKIRQKEEEEEGGGIRNENNLKSRQKKKFVSPEQAENGRRGERTEGKPGPTTVCTEPKNQFENRNDQRTKSRDRAVSTSKERQKKIKEVKKPERESQLESNPPEKFKGPCRVRSEPNKTNHERRDTPGAYRAAKRATIPERWVACENEKQTRRRKTNWHPFQKPKSEDGEGKMVGKLMNVPKIFYPMPDFEKGE